MDYGQLLSWIIGAVGLLGFHLAGKRVWWCWYVNIGCQVLWVTYAIITKQPAFIVTALFYTWIFGGNAYKWTVDHRVDKKMKELELNGQDSRHL